jgi:hypothetical protein
MLYFSALILLPFLLFLSIINFSKRKSYDTTHSLIFFAIIFAFVGETLMTFCAWYFKNNIPVYNSLSLFEFSFFFVFYYKIIGQGLNRFVYFLLLLIFFTSYSIELADKGLSSMFSYSFLYENSILIFLAIVAFLKMINKPQDSLISDYSVFWINTAVLTYFSCTFFIFGLRKYTVHLPALTLVTLYLHLFFIFVFYSLLSMGLWKTSKK